MLPLLAAVLGENVHLLLGRIDEPAVHNARNVAERRPAGHHAAEHGTELRIVAVSLEHVPLHLLQPFRRDRLVEILNVRPAFYIEINAVIWVDVDRL